MELPKKIDPCPIAEAIVELRFTSSKPDEAIFGLIYNRVKDRFPEFKNLPITELPETVRKNNPNLKYKALYRAESNGYLLNVGPRVISLIRKEPYNGWEEYSKDIKSIFNDLNEIEIVDDIVRLGLRYTNFFKDDIYSKTDLSLKLGEKNFLKKNTYIKNEFEDSGFKIILQLSNDSRYKKSGNEFKGSVIDIDVISTNLKKEFIGDPIPLLSEIHKTEKEIFFSVLSEDFIEELNPEY